MGESKRKALRLHNYDYSRNGGYFITICTKDKEKIFWEYYPHIVGANSVRPLEIHLSAAGRIAEQAIKNISVSYDNVVIIDKYVIMPNHIHMIAFINNDGRTLFAPTISRVIKQFKGVVTKQMGHSVWQRSFYDHVIRDEQDYLGIWEYIDNNPTSWLEDELYIE